MTSRIGKKPEPTQFYAAICALRRAGKKVRRDGNWTLVDGRQCSAYLVKKLAANWWASKKLPRVSCETLPHGRTKGLVSAGDTR